MASFLCPREYVLLRGLTPESGVSQLRLKQDWPWARSDCRTRGLAMGLGLLVHESRISMTLALVAMQQSSRCQP